ncbi:MAG: FAD-dependent oxidoreductase [Cyanobacteria bacterium J06635_15]
MSGSVSQRNGVFDEAVFTRPGADESLRCSILVVGGSTAAYSAALTALKLNLDVCLVQPQKVVGGQYTAQALPASDDSALLKRRRPLAPEDGEKFAISRAQKTFRDRQRQLQPIAGRTIANPGGGWVSTFAVTPVVAAKALNEALEPYLANGKLTLIADTAPIEVLFEDAPEPRRQVSGVVFQDNSRQVNFTVTAQVTIEATDLGDLLEVGEIPSRVGQEARSDTGEALLPEDARPQCQQSITFDAVVEYTPLGKGVDIGAPPGYNQTPWLQTQEFTADFWTRSINSPWRKWNFFSAFGIFRYRRLQRQKLAEKAVTPGDVAVINWGTSQTPDRPFCCGNDYRPGRLVGVSREERQQHIDRARDRTQAYLHFLQTQDSNQLKPRGDLTWTQDGIALEPYIREARRGIALSTIRHEDVAESFFPNQARARTFHDTVGIGQYHYLDLHGNAEAGHITPKGKDVIALPFTIPLGALVPLKTDGLILSAKSLGTTHITNAAYRMHPAEWAIGEASGMLAALTIWNDLPPRELATEAAHIRKLQGYLTRNGIPIFWFDDVAHDDPDFEPIQVMAAAGIIRSENNANLHFRPQAPVNRAVVCTALVHLLNLDPKVPAVPTFRDVRPGAHWAYATIETLHSYGMVAGMTNGNFAPNASMTRQHLSFLLKKAVPEAVDDAFANTPANRQLLKRRELSRVLYVVLKRRLGI